MLFRKPNAMKTWISDNDILAFEMAHPEAFERSRMAIRAVNQDAFNVILNVLRFYREAVTEEDKHLQNAAKRILYIAGTWIPENEENLSRALRTAPALTKQRGKQ